MSDLLVKDYDVKEIIVSVLFVNGEGIDIDYLAEKLQISRKKIDKEIEELKNKFRDDSGLHLISYKNKIQFTSNPKYSECIMEVLNPIKEKQITRTALETLAIICYKQPITKTEIEDLRGSSSDYALAILLRNNLITVLGRKDAVGKPLLYGTTEEFLKRFELQDLNELPDYDAILDKISVIKEQTDSLYNDFELPDESMGDNATAQIAEEAIPDFLTDEDVEYIN